MIHSMVATISSRLPLTVQRASWADPILTLGGSDWSFSSISSWRIGIAGGNVSKACADSSGVEDAVTKLVGQNVVQVKPQSEEVPIDPVFVFTDGTILEVFSTDTYEPWTLRVGDHIFVAPVDNS